MKKFIALLVAVILVCSMMTFTTSAAIPTELTITETKTAPNINDGGVIDAAYGEKVFDLKASELPKDSGNLYPSKMEGRDGEKLDDPKVQAAIKVMRNIGYMTYDKDNLYILCDVTDIAPKASSNSAQPWKSTNLQLTMFVNEELSFPTIAYEGKNKVNVWNDPRSVLDFELVEATFTEKSKTHYIYEIKIPWEAFPEVESADDVWYFRMGIVQTSMANDYVCSAFGEAYFLQAPKCIPVTLAKANESGNNTSSESSSEQNNTTSSTVSNNNTNTSSADKPSNNNSSATSSTDKNENTSSAAKPENNNSTTTSTNNNATSSADKPVTNNSATTSTDNKGETSSNNGTTSTGKQENTSSSDNNQNTGATSSTESTQDTSSVASQGQASGEQGSANAPTTGTDIVTDGSTNSETATESGTGETTTIVEESERDWTPIIIIAIVAVVIIAGGAVAIIMLNKKPSAESNNDK